MYEPQEGKTMMRTLKMLAVLLVAMPVAAHAAVVYENPWNSAAGDAGAFAQANQRLAGEFVLSAAATVGRATWHGTMFSADPLNTGDTWNFDVLFFSDGAGNLPGALLASASIVASVTDTGIDIQGERSYLFDASFAGVGLSAGVSYWFSVQNTGNQDTFRWTEATSGLDSALSRGGGPWETWTEEARTPVNFGLHDDAAAAPEPATLALLGLGLLAAAAIRRKH